MADTRKLSFETLNKENLYQGFFKLYRYQIRHELFAGGCSEPFTREIFERGQSAAVLLLDRQKEIVVLVEQFRAGAVETSANPWMLELVAGMIDVGEQAKDVAIREAVEEAGAAIQRISEICEYWVSPGGTTEKTRLYLGEIDSSVVAKYAGLADEQEDIKVHSLKVREAFVLLEQGKITNAMTLIALQWLKLNWHRKAQFWQ